MPGTKQYYVYLMSSFGKTLYVGVTSDLARRAEQHRNPTTSSFTSKYKITMLVYYEVTDDIVAAIAREKQIKGWRRERKIALVESVNPGWLDLSNEL
jgi:putative endonuclease